MRLCLFLVATSLFATTTIKVPEVSATQALIQITTDQGGLGVCTIRANQGTTLGAPYINDVNTTLFSGSNLDSRPGSLLVAGVHKFVLGLRLAKQSSLDNKRYSRAMQNVTTHIVGVTCGSDGEVTKIITTGNADTGITFQDFRFDRDNPGQYNYPSIPWATRNAQIIDPTNGVKVVAGTLPGDFLPFSQTETFLANLVPGTDWSCVGQACSYSGTSQGYLYLPSTVIPIADGSAALPTLLGGPPGAIGSNADYARLNATLSGSLASVNVFLTRNGVTPAGKAVLRTITGSPTSYTVGSTTAVFEDFRNSPVPPVGVQDIVRQTGTLTKTGTQLVWNTGNLFRYEDITAGSYIYIASSYCQVASIQSDKLLTLVSSGCVADGPAQFAVSNFGFLIQASSASSGTITLATGPTWTLGSSGINKMPDAGFYNNVCSPVPSTGPGSVIGYPCGTSAVYGPPHTYNTGDSVIWVGTNQTASVTGLSDLPTIPTGMFNNLCRGNNGMTWDGAQAGVYYCMGIPSPGPVAYNALIRAAYPGAYPAATPAFDSTLPGTTNSVLLSNISTAVSAFDTAGNFAAFAAALGNPSWQIQGWQSHGTNGALVLSAYWSQQNSPSWLAVVSLDTNTIIAASGTYSGVAGSNNRWCGFHSGTQSIQYNYEVLTCNTLPVGTSGFYSVGTTGTLGPAPWNTCPANTIGATGPNCSTITLNSLTPLDAASVSLAGQQLIVGDTLAIGSGECVRIATLSGLTAVVWRNQSVNPNSTACTGSTLSHPANSVLNPTATGFGYEHWWNWGGDPHGLAIIVDPVSADCHYGYGVNTYIEGCLGPTGVQANGKPIRNGPLPDNITATPFIVNFDAMFSTATQLVGDNQNNSHPSNSQSTANTQEQGHFIDNRPYGKSGIPTSGVTLVGGRTQTYLIPAASLPGFNYRVRQWAVSSNIKIAVDVSGPSSVLSDSNSDNYKYCYVLAANECVTGSTAGQAYVNLPFVSQLSGHSCYTGSASPTPINDIAIDEWQDTALGVLEADTTRSWDPTGSGIRLLSTAFAPICGESQFWNSREIAPAGIVWTTTDFLDGVQTQALMIKNPPFPPQTSTANNNYIHVTFRVSGVSGDSVRIQYGFAEYDQGQLALGQVPPCHSRNEGCFTNSSGSTPFLWASESQSATSCTAGCKVTAQVAPAPGGRMMYYQVVRTNNGVTTTSQMDVILVR